MKALKRFQSLAKALQALDLSQGLNAALAALAWAAIALFIDNEATLEASIAAVLGGAIAWVSSRPE